MRNRRPTRFQPAFLGMGFNLESRRPFRREEESTPQKVLSLFGIEPASIGVRCTIKEHGFVMLQ
jgi:hypothetical protein